ncbi:ABC transporter ATP-binding protein [Streptomyces sp. RKAG337]|uniref:ABC transporter ATP-binding protein n=1 Tax=Streptomyces sp. RKAG337 TaxID=2893404 RepID=UPI0020337970|nr:ABC transporter ATP-binding protein [Streptomyces sp. RKAG337]MCM2428652.1 ABC transporter ATP-binding protein/permease [Streptomyces sp. RKAG337]
MATSTGTETSGTSGTSGTTGTSTAAEADRLLRAAVRHSAGRSAALCLCTTASAFIGLALPAALGRTLDLLLTRDSGPQATHWILLCTALTCVLVLLDAVDGLITGVTNARGTAWVRGRLLRHVLATGPRATSRFPPGDLVARLIGNAAHAGTAPAALATLLATVITPVGGLVALALIDPWLAVAFLAGLPVLALTLRAFVRRATDSVARYQTAQGEIAGRLVEALGGARTIAAAATTEREIARVLEPLPELRRQGLRMWQVQGRSNAQAAIIVPLLQIAVLAVGGLRVSQGHLSVGELLAASRYAVLATALGMAVGQINGLVRSRTAARRLAELLAEPATAYGTGHLPAGGTGRLELRGITAVRGGRAVLDDLDLTLPGGTSVALVGRSGTGKSVLAAIAGRLADPDRGTVELDGVPLDGLSHDELRGAVGYAFERPALLGGTIGGTIAFGIPEPAGAAVTEAARTACADSFIRLLPEGYATACGDAFLSGGESQRLGLARAFAHPGRLLILDDATSSLDTVTEFRVTAALLSPTPDRSRLIVAHRASTAARADLVAWLDDGRIRAIAPHDHLWRLPEYRAVFHAPTDTDTDTDPDAGAERDSERDREGAAEEAGSW